MKLARFPLWFSVPALILFTGLLALIVLYVAELQSSFQRIERFETAQARLLGTLTSSDIEAALRRNDGVSAQRVLELARGDRDLERAALFDGNGKAVLVTHFVDRGLSLPQSPFADFQKSAEEALARRKAVFEIDREGELLYSAFPVEMGVLPGELRPSQEGVLITKHSLKVPLQLARADARRRLVAAAAVLALFSFLMWTYFRRVLLRRMNRLVKATEQIAGGNLDARADLTGNDELRRLSEALNRMIQQLRRSNEELRRSEEHFRSIVENTADVVSILDENLHFEYVSPSVRNVGGYSPESFKTRTALEGVHPDDVEEAERKIREVLDGRAASHMLLSRYQLADGSWGYYHSSILPYSTGDDRAHAILTSRDITELKRVEEERARLEIQLRQTQKMEAIGTLAGGVAHDFNNLLTAINGYADLLHDAMGKDHELIGEVEEIRTAGERAASLTRQLLLFSRQDVRQARTIDLNLLVRELNRMLVRLIGEHIHCSLTLAQEALPIFADPGQIEQIIVNLVVNARDALSEGGSIEIRTRKSELPSETSPETGSPAPGRYAQLTVADTGCGMSEAVLGRIFEPFFTTKEVGKGTGLGLATIYGIVKQCRGEIRVTSKEGEGSTFDVYLPLVSSEQLETDAKSRAAARRGGDETILFVEDERVVREVGSRILREQGYRVLEAVDGAEALEQVEEIHGDIHLVVTDLVMPRMTGRELARKLLSKYPTVKVLFVSGYAEHIPEGEALMKDQFPFLQKPYDPRSLAVKVRNVLDGTAISTFLLG